MKTFLLYSAFFLCLCIFIYGALKQSAEGSEQSPPFKFKTYQVRGLWQVCSTAFQSKNPKVNPFMYAHVCDCYVDHIRTQYTPERVDNMTLEESTQLSIDLKELCNPSSNKDKVIKT